MIDYAIAFVLGFIVAGLLSFAVLPAVWSRALRLTRRQLEASVPVSMVEVRAGRDLIRAEAAITQLRVEEKAEAERDRRHAVMAENGRLMTRLRLAEAERSSAGQALTLASDESMQRSHQIADLNLAISSLKTDLAAAQVTGAMHEEKAGSLRRELEKAGETAATLRTELEAQRAAHASSGDMLRRRDEEIERLGRVLAETEARLAGLDTELAGNRAEVEKNRAEMASLSNRSDELGHANAELLIEKAKLVDTNQSMERRLTSQIALARRYERDLADKDGRLAFATARETELANDIARLNGGRGASPDAGQAETAMRLATLEVERTRLEGELNRLQRQVKAERGKPAASDEALRAEIVRLAGVLARDAGGRGQRAVPRSHPDRLPANDLKRPGRKAEAREEHAETPTV